MSQDRSDQGKKRGPNIRIPPAFFVAAFLIALLADAMVVHLPLAGEAATGRLVDVGWVVVLLGLGISLSGVATFGVVGTTMFPFVPASRMVQQGPYRYTRNPMYLGMAVVYVGFSLVVNSAWPLLLLPLALVGLYRFVIAVEERYLEATFGEEYLGYKKKVRRWL